MSNRSIRITPERENILSNFDTERYEILNRIRWDVLLGMGLPIAGATIFEPGAGVGDQTQWLLDQGAAHVIVNDGREGNLDIIRERFASDTRISTVGGDLETSKWPKLADQSVDLVFLWGVYYHIKDDYESFNVLKSLARVGKSIVMEFLECESDSIEAYGYQNPSTSLSEFGIRPTMASVLKGLKLHWPHVYLPAQQMDWVDPCVPTTPRRIVYASVEKVQSEKLVEQ